MFFWHIQMDDKGGLVAFDRDVERFQHVEQRTEKTFGILERANNKTIEKLEKFDETMHTF